MLSDVIAVFQLSNGPDYTHTEEHVLWVIDEVSTVEEPRRYVYHSYSDQLSVNSMVEMIRSQRIRVDTFVFKSVVQPIDVFRVEYGWCIGFLRLFHGVVQWAVAKEPL